MGKRSLAVLAVVVLVPCLLFVVRPRRAYPRLVELDPDRTLLQDRKRLIEVASTHEAPPGPPSEHPWDRTLEIRFEALDRLLELQPPRKLREIRRGGRKGLGIDHRHVGLEARSQEKIVLVATLSETADLPGRHPWFWQPKYKSDYEDYWSMDLLEFDGLGNLLSWSPYRSSH